MAGLLITLRWHRRARRASQRYAAAARAVPVPLRRQAARLGALVLALAVGGALVLTGRQLRRVSEAQASWVELGSLGAFGPAQRLPPVAAVPAPAIGAAQAVLLDAAGARVLYARNPYARVYPASVTKILTAYATVEAANRPGGGGLDQLVTVPARATRVGGSSAYLRAGERISVRDLLYAMLLASGNDAAETLAEHFAGSPAAVPGFLNAAAAEVGAAATHFTNASGMPAADHVTTAFDLALITRAALALAPISQIVATRSYTVTFADGRTLTYRNENRLLGQAGIDGVKTGYTVAAGQTYVASATRDGRRLIAVVLGSSRRGKYSDALALLNWGFAQFSNQPLPAPGRVVGQSQLATGGGFVDLTLPGGVPTAVAVLPGEQVAVTTDAPVVVAGPIARGQRLGTLTEWIGGQAYASWPLLAAWPAAG